VTVAEDVKATLVTYLQRGRDSLVWKLDGLSEYDARRPMTPTGTSLLGLVKHCAWVEAGYFGETFGRPFPEPAPWDGHEGADPHDDLYALATESREDVLGLYQRVQEWAAQTIEELDLDAEGHVPWWGDRNPVTLHCILVHCIAEVQHHAGHADIVRETIDGATGYLPQHSNHPDDGYDWPAYLARVQAAADGFR
jgi:uncharacterized damage-inducible protein DinB